MNFIKQIYGLFNGAKDDGCVKAAMKKYFDALETLYKDKTGDLPYFPYDPTLPPIIYVGSPTKEEWIRWRAVEKNTVTDLTKLEEQLHIKFHSSIFEYFNSYWFAFLNGTVAESECELLPVLPGREIDEFVTLQYQYSQYCASLNRPMKYTPIGSEVEPSNAIVVNNINGKVFVEDIESQSYKLISKSLARFIEMLI